MINCVKSQDEMVDQDENLHEEVMNDLDINLLDRVMEIKVWLT